MAVIRVIRNKRQRQGYMKKLINDVWNRPDTICRWGGYLDDSGAIISSFEMVQRAYGSLAIPVHCFQLIFEPGTNIQMAQTFVGTVVQYLNSEYQTIAVLDHNNDGLLEATFVLNAVSYKNGSVFHDNNHTYLQLQKTLESLSGQKWVFEAGDSVFFTNEDDSECFQDYNAEYN
ncbi:MAG: hypothetical protein E7288_03745 [Lachnospiraceae bacterium]|nr:hypothetical protein [Lachnospiraceae bacterium]